MKGQIGIPLTIVLSGISTLALALSGWFATNETMLSTRVDTLSTAQAATAQQTSDIDARLTRIENKLDSALNSK